MVVTGSTVEDLISGGLSPGSNAVFVPIATSRSCYYCRRHQYQSSQRFQNVFHGFNNSLPPLASGKCGIVLETKPKKLNGVEPCSAAVV